MSTDSDLILAGVGLPSLAFIGPKGTALPTTAEMTLNVAFLDAGFCASDGLQRDFNTSSTPFVPYGMTAPARVFKTSEDKTFRVIFAETNPVTQAVWFGKALADVVPDDDGKFAIEEGPVSRILYAAVFHIVDGDNLIRSACANVELTSRGTWQATAGAPMLYDCTFTAYPDDAGNSVYNYFTIGALAS